jgi:hypothetical protein
MFTGRESKGASIVLSGETPGKDELKFLHQRRIVFFYFDFSFSLAFKILSIVVVENGIWVITVFV